MVTVYETVVEYHKQNIDADIIYRAYWDFLSFTCTGKSKSKISRILIL